MLYAFHGSDLRLKKNKLACVEAWTLLAIRVNVFWTLAQSVHLVTLYIRS